MSWSALRWAITQETGSATAKAVLLVLAEAANGRTAACTLSQATIAGRSELSPRAVFDGLRRLEELGLIGRRRRASGRGQRTSDHITLLIAPAANRDATPNSHETQVGGGKPTRTSRRSYSQLPPTLLAPGAKEPGDEPGDEPVDISPVVPSGAAKARRHRAGAPLPSGFPDDAAVMRLQERFAAEGLEVDPTDQAERFRAYHEARGTLSASWPASWTTWTLNGLRMARERRAASPQPASPIDWALQGIANR